MPTPYTQRDPKWKDKPLDSSGLTVDLFGCLALAVLHQSNRFEGKNHAPDFFVDWLNRNAGFTRDGLFIWSKVSEWTSGRLRYLGSGLWARLRKKYTLQQVAFGRLNHWVARLPGRDVYDPWQGRITQIVDNHIVIDGKPRKLLNNFRYIG
jgi:hypothetical protein